MRMGTSMSVVDCFNIASSYSVRNFVRLGSAMSMVGRGQMGAQLFEKCISRDKLCPLFEGFLA